MSKRRRDELDVSSDRDRALTDLKDQDSKQAPVEEVAKKQGPSASAAS